MSSLLFGLTPLPVGVQLMKLAKVDDYGAIIQKKPLR